MIDLRFEVFTQPEPQGSSRAFVRGGRAVITSANPKLKQFRHDVTRIARRTVADLELPEPAAGKHVPVRLRIAFTFRKPPSVPKKRAEMVVKPDLDKAVRGTLDALTGVLYLDDAQVVELRVTKQYGAVDSVAVRMVCA